MNQPFKILTLAVILLLAFTSTSMAAVKKSRISLDNVEILQAVKVMGKLTKRTFVFTDKDLSGKKITILSEQEFTPDEAFSIFEAVLQINDLTTVNEGKVTRIIPLNDAKTSMPPVKLVKGGKSSYVTRVIPIKYLNVKAVRASLASLIPKTAILAQSPEANVLILKDTKENGERFAQMVAIIDRPKGQMSGPEIIPLKYANASEAQILLSKIFSPSNKNQQTLSIFAEKRTNSLIAIGLPSAIINLKSLLLKMDVKTQEGGNIRVYPLKSANASEVSKILSKFASDLKNKKTSSGKSVQISITSDVASNSLIIFADQANFEALENVISKLDIVREQVFIQALIMELKLDKSLDLGVDWQAGKINEVGYNGNPITGDSATSQGLVTVGGPNATGSPTAFPATSTTGAQIGVVGGPITFGGSTFSTFNAFIRATQGDTEIDILSNPQILTLNNEEAEIKVGEVIPTLGATTVDTAGNSTTAIEYKEVGIALKITPRINKDGTIEMVIDEQSSNLVDTATVSIAGAITTLNRSLKTKVVVKDGQTIALGGLISDEQTEVEFKTPCLGDIPILGWLFKTQSATTKKTNLMIFLTPKIVSGSRELAEVSESARLKLKSGRNNHFRIDVSKEYKMPSISGAEDLEPPREGAPLDILPRD
ncbi:MAG: type II secretion system secretin GspD [SAR324 cluster bacterium]|nr:type II secretion system secretin GspD [SAR324 cluster bacterium]